MPILCCKIRSKFIYITRYQINLLKFMLTCQTTICQLFMFVITNEAYSQLQLRGQFRLTLAPHRVCVQNFHQPIQSGHFVCHFFPAKSKQYLKFPIKICECADTILIIDIKTLPSPHFLPLNWIENSRISSVAVFEFEFVTVAK